MAALMSNPKAFARSPPIRRRSPVCAKAAQSAVRRSLRPQQARTPSCCSAAYGHSAAIAGARLASCGPRRNRGQCGGLRQLCVQRQCLPQRRVEGSVECQHGEQRLGLPAARRRQQGDAGAQRRSARCSARSPPMPRAFKALSGQPPALAAAVKSAAAAAAAASAGISSAACPRSAANSHGLRALAGQPKALQAIAGHSNAFAALAGHPAALAAIMANGSAFSSFANNANAFQQRRVECCSRRSHGEQRLCVPAARRGQ